MKTLQTRYIEAVGARGCTVVRGKFGKYITLTRNKPTKDGKPTFYFVGKSGAIRIGTNATASVPASDAFKAGLLAQGNVIDL